MTDAEDSADFYTSLIPSYLKGDFADVSQAAGSVPIFAQAEAVGSEGERAAEKKNVEQITHGKIK